MVGLKLLSLNHIPIWLPFIAGRTLRLWPQTHFQREGFYRSIPYMLNSASSIVSHKSGENLGGSGYKCVPKIHKEERPVHHLQGISEGFLSLAEWSL